MRALWIIVLLLAVLVGLILLLTIGVPVMAAQAYGPAAPGLGAGQVVQYSARLLWDDGLLVKPLDPNGPEQQFEVQHGESIASVCGRLQSSGIVRDASMLRDYLIYTGLDATLQAGAYQVDSAMSIVDIAHTMQDPTPADVTFGILPGWRIEEIAASLPTSGLSITPDQFVAAASAPRSGFDFLNDAATTEGFLYPDSYVLPRGSTVDDLIDTLLRNFSLHLTVDLKEGFARDGLTEYQAVTLASIVQREAVRQEEAPVIASVYLNRLKVGMPLEADPTVQYALGYSAIQHTWWTNPLTLGDLKYGSVYNTYLNAGLPPAPIDSPGLGALQAVASPDDTPYYYFTARCDNSGYHVFAETFDEHLKNLCP
jgi:UPF0755 protein